MHRLVVLDTNVVVSAFMSPQGNPAKILDMVTDEKIGVCYSSKILAEYIEVLSRPRFNFCEDDRAAFIQGVRQFGMLVDPSPSDLSFPDESDRVFYDVAKLVDAFLITGNIKHFPDESFIVTPVEFLVLANDYL